jgi:hypothetical protein
MVAFMWGLLLLLVVAMGLAEVAGGLQYQGVRWAFQVCTSAPMLCDHPGWIATSAASMALLYLLRNQIKI